MGYLDSIMFIWGLSNTEEGYFEILQRGVYLKDDE